MSLTELRPLWRLAVTAEAVPMAREEPRWPGTVAEPAALVGEIAQAARAI